MGVCAFLVVVLVSYGNTYLFKILFIKLGIVIHDLAERKPLHKIQNAHKGKVSGLCFTPEGKLLSCGVDRNVKLWSPGTEFETLVSDFRLVSSHEY
jgi:WD40 repeat protein